MRLDALRGVFLIIMAAVHVPTPLSSWLHEPFGYFSSAEGFIFLSASLAGLVYGKVYARKGWDAMASKVWQRTFKVYGAHLAVLFPVVLLAWLLAGQFTPLANHFHDFLQRPVQNLFLIPLLVQRPPLFDILPLYVIFLALTPLVFAAARALGWGPVLAGSLGMWMCAQPGWNTWFSAGRPGLLNPLSSGPFHLPSWQVLWIGGLALGQCAGGGLVLSSLGRRLLGGLGGGLVLAGLISRHGGFALPEVVCQWLDKWSLGPLRMLNFGAWVLMLLAWNPTLPAWLLRGPALLGRHSLTVFSSHLVLAVGAGCLVQSIPMEPWLQVNLGLAVVGALFLVAWWEENRAQAKPAPVSYSLPAAASVVPNPLPKQA